MYDSNLPSQMNRSALEQYSSLTVISLMPDAEYWPSVEAAIAGSLQFLEHEVRSKASVQPDLQILTGEKPHGSV